MLNMLIGRKNVGKSSCIAWLLAKAARPAILPGYEESVELMMLGRWAAHGVPLDRLLVLRDKHYQPSLQIDHMVRILRAHRCDLLAIEGIGSYMPADAGHNDPQAVRPFLEALHTIADRSGACIVGTRHPGKDPGNLCPGSHEWEDVPRISVVLEREERRSPTYWMWSHRCGVGVQPEPLSYTLVKTGAAPPVFTPAAKSDRAALEMCQSAPDVLDRDRLQTAVDLLSALLQDEWIESREIFAAAERERLGEGTVRRAAAILEIQKMREGEGIAHKSLWAKKGLDRPWSDKDAR